ncbi:PAS domain-containing sensor histidine kinase [Bacillus sp. FJAT-44742]|uniref:PAS domain-containing sensor histidine kinase n=1 Tax=Bacillus sp. FJAT-44742 TaxID=2014005 RepID=UPI0018E222CC|nr:PAS domain-containing sensor histidine kinase [Bacillus sp. FJAT-44742]
MSTQDIYDKLNIPIVISGLDGTVTFANHKHKQTVGNELVGTNIFQYICEHQQTGIKDYIGRLTNEKDNKRDDGYVVDYVFNGRKQTGEMKLLNQAQLLFQFSTTEHPLTDPHEIYKEITRMILMEKPLIEILFELQSKLEKYLCQAGSCSVFFIDYAGKIDYRLESYEHISFPLQIVTQKEKKLGQNGKVKDLSAGKANKSVRQNFFDTFYASQNSIEAAPILLEKQKVGELVFSISPDVSLSKEKLDVLSVCGFLVSMALEKKSLGKGHPTDGIEAKLIAEYAGDSIVVLDREGIVHYASPSNASILGYPIHEYIGKNALHYIHPEDLPLAEKKLEEGLRRKKEFSLEVRYLREDHSYIDISLKAKPVLSQDNQVHRIVVIGRDITEKKEAKRRLEESKQRYQSLFDHNPYPVLTLSLTGEVLTVNQSLESFLGYQKEELIGTYEKFIHPDYLTYTKEYFKRATDGTSQAYETLGIHKKGHKIWFKVTNIPVKVKGKVVAVFGVMEDITEKKKAQKRVKDREEQLQALINSLPEFVLFKDKKGNLIEMNDSARALLGMEGKDPLCYSSVVPSYNLSLIHSYERDEEAWKEPGGIQYEQKICHPDGQAKVYEIVKAPQFDKKGARKYLVTIGRDITTRKEMEGELQETQEQLWALYNDSADPISLLSLDGNILKANPAFYDLYGYRSSPESINVFHDLTPEEIREETENVICRAKRGEQVIDYETVRKRNDGALIDVSLTYSPIRDRNGKISGISAITRDIRDRKKTEDLLRRSEKLSVLGQLAAAVAHEVRNPLTTVKGFTQFLQDKSEYTGLMLSELDRIEVIINEFLTLAKPQAVTFKEEDIGEVIKNVLSLINTQAALNDIEIKTYLEAKKLPIYCDSNQIKQVLLNILKNALEAMPCGGILVVKTREISSYCQIEVIDEGVGIAPERIKKLGEPFYSNKEKGTGLGLMVCYKIIEEHQGTITIESEEGVGTTVKMSLPIFHSEQSP